MENKRALAAWVALLLGQAVSPASPQLPPSQAAAPLARLVNLSVVALGPHDQPVADLTAADFTVTDAGKPQEIVYFRRNAEAASGAAPLGPHEFSNRSGAKLARATVILFDRMNDSIGPSGAALSQLIHALGHVESGSEIYLYYFTKQARLYPVRPLPGGDNAAPPAASAGAEGNWTRQAKTMIEAANNATFGMRPGGLDEFQLVALTYQGLGALARRMAVIPGRKSIVWITHGVPIMLRDAGGNPVDFTPYLRQLSAELDRDNVALYPVQQTPPGMAMGGPEAQHSGLGSEDTLQQFADLTGGRASPGGDIGAVLEHARNDVRTSYQIAYLPPDANWDSKFHKLKIACARKGVHVQAKTGYYAWPEEAADERDAMAAIAGSPSDAAEIGLRVRATPSEGGLHLEVRIDPADIALLRDGADYTGALRMAFAGYNAEGQAQLSAIVPFDFKLTAAQRGQAVKQGMGYVHNLKLGAGIRRVRVIVLDGRLNTAGSVTIPASEP